MVYCSNELTHQLLPGSPILFLRFGQVVSYLYQSVEYCVKFPATAKGAYLAMLSAASVFALDPTFRMPCYMRDAWDGYKTKQSIAMLLPIGLLVLVGLWALAERGVAALRKNRSKRRAEAAAGGPHADHARDHRRKDASAGDLKSTVAKLSASAEALAQAKKKEKDHEAELLWTHASRACLVLDLVYPFVCRTVLEHWTCRDLGEGNVYLEADFRESMRCYVDGGWWVGRLPLVVLAAVVYCLGIPALFLSIVFHLLKRHKRARHASFVLRRRMSNLHADLHAGHKSDNRSTRLMVAAAKMADDKINKEKANVKAFSWMYDPYKRSTVWWIGVEMLRRLLLTSCMGLIGGAFCNVKAAAALLISLFYALAFLSVKPYRKSSDNTLQAAAIVVPCFMMAYTTTSLKLVDDTRDAVRAQTLAEGVMADPLSTDDQVSAALKSSETASALAASYETQSMMVLSLHAAVVVPFVLGVLAIIGGAVYLVFKEAFSKAVEGDEISLADAMLEDDALLENDDEDDVLHGGEAEKALRGSSMVMRGRSKKRKKKRRHTVQNVLGAGFRSPSSLALPAGPPAKKTSRTLANSRPTGGGRRASISPDSRPAGLQPPKQRRKSSLKGAVDAAKLATKSNRRKTRGKKKERKNSTSLIKEAFDAIDADHDGSWTFDEFVTVCASDDVAGVRKLFDILDRDRSGEVDFKEVCRSLRTDDAASALAAKFEPLKRLVRLTKPTARRRGSTTKARKQSKRHLKGAADAVRMSSRPKKSRRKKQQKEMMKAAFGAIDIDGDGLLEWDEFCAVCLHGDKHDHDDTLDRQEARALFDLLDEDSSGALDVAEITHALKTNPAAKELATHYDSLHDLVSVASARKRRRSSAHGKSRRKQASPKRKQTTLLPIPETLAGVKGPPR
jgi:Ca2+-binding EF-hand superfamily protein